MTISVEIIQLVSQVSRDKGRMEGMFEVLRMYFLPDVIESIKERTFGYPPLFDAMQVLHKVLLETLDN